MFDVIEIAIITANSKHCYGCYSLKNEWGSYYFHWNRKKHEFEFIQSPLTKQDNPIDHEFRAKQIAAPQVTSTTKTDTMRRRIYHMVKKDVAVHLLRKDRA